MITVIDENFNDDKESRVTVLCMIPTKKKKKKER